MSMRERIKSSLAHASGSVRCHFGTFETASICRYYALSRGFAKRAVWFHSARPQPESNRFRCRRISLPPSFHLRAKEGRIRYQACVACESGGPSPQRTWEGRDDQSEGNLSGSIHIASGHRISNDHGSRTQGGRSNSPLSPHRIGWGVVHRSAISGDQRNSDFLVSEGFHRWLNGGMQIAA